MTTPSSDHRTHTRTTLLAAAGAVTAANVYLNQPLLTAAAHDLHRAPALLGAVPTATQLGYALGIALLVPAGDSQDRRRLILLLGAAATLALAACALAPGVPWLVAASLALGLCSPVPQLVAPLAVALAGGQRPGRVVGTIQGGLLVGVLGARAYSGALAQLCGWRAVYGCSAGLTLLLTVLLWRALPAAVPTGSTSYRAAVASLPRLFTGHALVRRVTLSGGLVGVSFGAFWTALTFLLAQHYRYDSTGIGLFGLVAAASALASPPIGRLADRLGQRGALTALITVVLAGWALLLPGAGSLGWLLAGVVVLDVGTWGNQVVCQSALFAHFPADLHSRLNTCYFTLRFLGIALGSLAGSLAWQHGGWPVVTALGAAAAGAALAVAAGPAGDVRRPRRWRPAGPSGAAVTMRRRPTGA
ncbi:MFS transporter [Kitasatospora sp. NPDC008050]|uniref:MFS transporter n=1 Tax=Kitasatospora sp. NPDC008050 TaxID=3364021 RepID=UPI0036E10688